MNNFFEWDEEKRKLNIAKHGVDFILAARIFANKTVEKQDTRQDYGEKRYAALGYSEDVFYTVIYTWRNSSRGKIRRIISAWKEGDNGKRRYQAILFE